MIPIQMAMTSIRSWQKVGFFFSPIKSSHVSLEKKNEIESKHSIYISFLHHLPLLKKKKKKTHSAYDFFIFFSTFTTYAISVWRATKRGKVKEN
jgi:hypothetical protein